VKLARGLARFVIILLAAGLPLAGAEKDDTPELERPQDTAAAAFALKVHLELERSRLERSLTEYQAAEKQREELRDRISSLYRRLGAVVRKEPLPPNEDSEESLQLQIESAERAEDLTRQNLRRLLEQIDDSRERMLFITARLGTLRRAPPPEEPEGAEGVWDIIYLPSNDKAVFTLRQSGVIVEGEYQHEGGYHGSLQGTLINNKIVLHRIDSKLGAISDLEGQIASDLKSVKGTWMTRIISDGGPVTGSWSGRKRESRKKADGGAP
jgi:hypothetical protein